MTVVAIREKLTAYLQIADDKKVKAMYALLEDDIMFGEKVTIEQYNKDLDEAVLEEEKGNYVLQDEMEKIASKW